MNRTLLTFLLLTVPALAGAQSLQSAQEQFDQGKWQDAASAAVALNTSAGYTLAAEATTLGAASLPEGQRKAQFEKAQDYAKKGIAADANNADAYFELARAQGRLAQMVGIMQSAGIASDVKKNLEQAIRLNPKLAGAYVALGLWHANLVAKAGPLAGLKGASKGQVVPNFKKALDLEPAVAIHRIEYVNALQTIGFNDKKFMMNQLQAAASFPAKTYWEKQDQATAQAMLNKLK